MIQIEMEIPKRCGECRFASAFDCLLNGKFITDHNERAEHCPLQERPQGEWWPCTKEGLPLTEYLCKYEAQKWYGYKCSHCTFIYKGNALTQSPYCQKCGSDNRKKGDENA